MHITIYIYIVLGLIEAVCLYCPCFGRKGRIRLDELLSLASYSPKFGLGVSRTSLISLTEYPKSGAGQLLFGVMLANKRNMSLEVLPRGLVSLTGAPQDNTSIHHKCRALPLILSPSQLKYKFSSQVTRHRSLLQPLFQHHYIPPG